MQSVAIRCSLNIDAESIIQDLTSDIDLKGIAGALLFLAPDIDMQKVCSYFDEKFTYAGCTVNNSFCSERPEHATTSQTAIIIYFMGSEMLASGFLSSFPKSKDKLFCFTTNEAITRDYLHLKMIGGFASGSIVRDKPAVWCNHIFSHESAVAMGIPDVALSVDVAHGWSTISNYSMEITKACGTTILELDGKSAAETYTGFVHEKSVAPLYPIYSADKKKFITILSIDDANGALHVSQPLEEGDRITLSSSSRAEVLNSTNTLASDHYVENNIFPPELVMFFSCSSREWLLCEDPSAEFAKVLPLFKGEKVALVYLDGEFAPIADRTEHFNHSLVMAKLYSAESEKLSEI